MRRKTVLVVALITLVAAACASEATPDTTEWTGTVVRIQVTTSTAAPTTTATTLPPTTTTAEPFEPTPEMLALVGTYQISTIFFQLSAHGVIAHGSSLDTMTNLGRWYAEGTTLTIIDLDLGADGCAGAVGQFRYQVGSSHLTLTALDDPCTFRANWFTKTFNRLS
jgi:hypothetical protein